MDAKITCSKFDVEWDFVWKSLHKGTKSTLTVKKPGRQQRTQVIKVNIAKWDEVKNCIAPERMQWGHRVTFMILLPKIHNVNAIMRNHQMARVKDILLNNWPIIFKIANVSKAKEISRTCLRLKEIKATWSPFAITYILGQLGTLVCGLNGSNELILLLILNIILELLRKDIICRKYILK